MKKAKRAKKTVRKVARKPNNARRKPARKKVVSPPPSTDLWGYQWVTLGSPRKPGWSEVPYSRHAHDFPSSYNLYGNISHGGLVLVEALADQVVAERYALEKMARDQLGEFDERTLGGLKGEGRGFYIIPITTKEI